jgi:hypothetical protein
MHVAKGKVNGTTTYRDSNLMHDLFTGSIMSGIITLINNTPIQWFCKNQTTVKTYACGSKYVVTRQATERIMDLRYTLSMLGIPIMTPPGYLGTFKALSHHPWSLL